MALPKHVLVPVADFDFRIRLFCSQRGWVRYCVSVFALLSICHFVGVL